MKKIIYFATILLVFSGCQNKEGNSIVTLPAQDGNVLKLNDAQMKNAEIITGEIEQKGISSVLKLNGKIDVPPQNMISVSLPMGGYLKSTKLLPGMHVVKGQVIAIVEDQQYIQLQQDYLTAKAKIGFFENEYKRQKDLNQSKASSDKNYQQAEADYRSLLVLMTALKEKLKLVGINVQHINENKIQTNINIYAPINGYVSKVNVNVGKYVNPTEVLFDLVNPSDIHLALKVFERDLHQLYIGQQLFAYTNNDLGKKLKCTILLIGKDLSTDGNADVHCHFETYDKSLVPGTFMNAEILLKNVSSAAVPTDALVQFEGKQFLFLAKNKNTFELKEVKVGENEGGFTAVGLTDGVDFKTDKVVVKGAYSLLMMMKNKEE
ncbi:efflux RND transporter periplasmic adaptor subunit [Pedobacter sp. N36a]|uniref:efflux RND transporter periplasmic adaptor subunit n=1 Tax=Pedobacter sp. N36a TaxID=2767996 RepID=UPI001656EF5D|nr:efflux RND transporter periplasmic adaptor subunit [Pedobacter sp. N36a]MBC8984899.1 efflux RND transporter periplasmic adaptor subunit [Pedobacter sp. N36a]